MDPSSIDGRSAQPFGDTIPHEDRSGAGHDSALGICRICRGEGTSAEPLFYPCKCSGSIKFVHQDCLMEWLSHSQKKYCELCKTSFRFTKLYAPDMPQSLPVHIFVEHMAKYMFRHILVWLRAAMAISVWVFWLPYFMRAVWSFMFWISDEGLGTASVLTRSQNASSANPTLPSSIVDIGTCPTSPLLAVPMTSVAEANAIMGQIPAEDMSEYLVRIFLGSLGMPSALNHSSTGKVANQSTPSDLDPASAANSTSLLSNVPLLRTITRSPTLNRAIVSVLEGQAITLLIIVSFILVILVRDYVVQQQPEINMRAAFAAPENNLPDPEPANDPVEQHNYDVSDTDDTDDTDETDDTVSDDETLDDGSQAGEQDWPAHAMEELGPTVEDPSGPEASGHETSDQFQSTNEGALETATILPLLHARADGGDNESSAERPSVLDYLRIYRRADGNLEEILRIVEEEGLQDKLKYWVDVTRRSLKEQAYRKAASHNNGDPMDPFSSHKAVDEGSLESERAMSRPPSPTLGGEGQGKGKGRALPPSYNTDAPAAQLYIPEPHNHHLRPRATSEGPLVEHSVNPLANNTWTFTALETDDDQNRPQGSTDLPVPPIRIPAEESSSSSGWHLPSFLLESANVEQDDANTTGKMRGSHDENLVDVLEQDDLDIPRMAVEDVRILGRGTGLDFGNLHDSQSTDSAAEDSSLVADADHDHHFHNRPAAVAAEARFNDQADNDEDDHGNDNNEDEEDVAGDDGGAGANPAFDAEAIEDMEDFEGVMELIGMRGPIAGLFQNAIFCAVLVSVTIFTCIFIPYNIGRIALWILARPMRLVRMLFELSKLTQDAAVLLGGLGSWFVLNIVDMFTNFIGGSIASQVVSARKMSWALWTNAGSRVLDYVFMDFPMTASEIQNFSAISHDALNTVKGNIGYLFTSIDDAMLALCNVGFAGFFTGAAAALSSVSETSANVSAWLMNPSLWVIHLGGAEERPPINPELAHWSSLDRFWAIIAGYTSLCMLSALYLQRDGPFSRGTVMHAWEVGVIDTLQQASGILKVILIISIEMLAFPLYCGLLLDLALLPLFEGATFKSRMLFTYNYPMTSVFVHWFVGTGYMFHFALFVSMCRKIMRPGVLYFIRDPDDPEFHPVRDVLERNLTTQLRKILFSAFVYGALVIVCLGGVVWGVAYAAPGVLPIHYSSNEPVLEFPVDLLFYNFLMPLAVKFFKPSDALHTMYTWWFRKCARSLRLTFFLFGERRIDEEGTLQLSSSSPSSSSPKALYMSMFLEVDETNTVIPKTWRDSFTGGDAKPNPPTSSEERKEMRHNKRQLVQSGQLAASGYFVRAPASDRVKIPPGQKVFLTVSERGRRQDGQADTGLYASDQYQLVYVPSNFRSRIFVFIVSIWVFAAITGVGLTIVPLVFGRRVFKALIPEHIRTNDIYAFSIGIFTLGTAAYTAFHVHTMINRMQKWIDHARRDIMNGNAPKRIAAALVHMAKLAYSYFFLLIVFPLLSSMMLELYVIVPLHTYMYPPTTLSTQQDAKVDRHTVRVIQSWTLGLLYLKLGSRMITSMFPDSRAANAVRSIMRRGWLRPDIGLLTRAFIAPGLAAAAAAIFGPPVVANFVIHRSKMGGGGGGGGGDPAEEAAEAVKMMVMYRQSYPAAAFAAIFVKNVVTLVNALDHWTAGVRDEAYLIGERLHNFGAGAGVRKGRRMWGGGRQRL